MFNMRWETLPMIDHRVDPGLPQARRCAAVAAILAKAVFRHRHAAEADTCPTDMRSCDSPQTCLGTVDTSRPCVPAGSGGYAPREP